MLAEDLRIQRDPFEPTADPSFCYLDSLRRHGSARLLSGLYEGGGLYALCGKPGSGKSMLLRYLSEQLDALDGILPLSAAKVFTCGPGTTLTDILAACEARLGLGESAAASLKAAKRLQELVESNRSPVLILDDAGILNDDALEAIVTLTGLQAADRQLLSVVLAGTADFAARLGASFEGAGGSAAERCIELQPLSESDVARLIRHRLRVAGRSEESFAADAVASVFRQSAGVPLAVVRTCRRALQLAESRSRKIVTADLVAEAVAEEGSGGPREVSARPGGAAVSGPASPTVPGGSTAARPLSSSSFGRPRVAPPVAGDRPEQQPEQKANGGVGSATSSADAEHRTTRPAQAPQGQQTPEPKAATAQTDSPAGPQPADSRGAHSRPGEKPPRPPHDPAAAQPSLRREPHRSIPGVTVGHHDSGRPARTAESDAGAGRRSEAWWSSSIIDRDARGFAPHDYDVAGRQSRRGRKVLAVTATALLLLVASAGLIVMGDARELVRSLDAWYTTAFGDRPAVPSSNEQRSVLQSRQGEPIVPPSVTPGLSRTPAAPSSPTTGSRESNAPASGDLGRFSDRFGVEQAAPDRRLPPLGNSDSAATPPRPAPRSDTLVRPEPAQTAAPSEKLEAPGGSLSAPQPKPAPPPPAPANTELQPSSVVPPQQSPPSPPQPASPPQPHPKVEAQGKPALPAQASAEQQRMAVPVPRSGDAKASPLSSKQPQTRNREIDTLISEGDALREEGDLAAARSVYEQAYDRGSAAAAVRMAQSFDPRSVAADARAASPAEAILWYQDAARKGDKRAREQLDNLATWLENSAASGNQEARRVLELWREPAEVGGDQQEQ